LGESIPLPKVVLITGFLIAFAAGLVVGLGVRKEAVAGAATGGATRPSRHSFLTTELGLTQAQQEQMRKIWSDAAHRGGREQDERRRQFRKERDDAVAALVPEADKPKYEAANKQYAERMAAMEKEWRASYAGAVERTKQILTDEQRQKYEELLKKQEADRAARDAERKAAEDKSKENGGEKRS
jgi:Spy/CpxP family protein refolding chaperone